MNNRGQIQDVYWILIVLFVVAIVLVAFLYISHSIDSQMTPIFNNNTADSGTNSVHKVDSILTGSMDNFFFAIFMAYIIALVISSFLIRTHPIFLPIFIVMLVLGVIVAVVFSNFYEDYKTNPAFTALQGNFVKMNYIMSNLPIIFTILGIVAIIVLFAKSPMPETVGMG